MQTLKVLRLDCHLRANTYDLLGGGCGLCLVLQPSKEEAKLLNELHAGERLHIELSVGLAYEGTVVFGGPSRVFMMEGRYQVMLTDFKAVMAG